MRKIIQPNWEPIDPDPMDKELAEHALKMFLGFKHQCWEYRITEIEPDKWVVESRQIK